MSKTKIKVEFGNEAFIESPYQEVEVDDEMLGALWKITHEDLEESEYLSFLDYPELYSWLVQGQQKEDTDKFNEWIKAIPEGYYINFLDWATANIDWEDKDYSHLVKKEENAKQEDKDLDN